MFREWQCCGPYYIDADPYPACHFDADADPDPNPSFQVKAQNLEKVLKYAHIPHILACHLQIDADPGPDTGYNFDADADPDPTFQFEADPEPEPTFQFDTDPDPDPQHWREEYLRVNLLFSL